MRRRATASPRYALLTLSGAPHDDTVFGARSPHGGSAVGAAFAAHAIVVLALAGVGRLHPPAAAETPPIPSAIERFIFTRPSPDGGGQARGGNASTAPAPLARSRGAAAHAVMTAPSRAFVAPDTIAPEREPLPALPVLAMNAGDLLQAGALDGVPGPPTDARGPGESGAGTGPGSSRGLGGVPGNGVGEGPYGIGNGVTGPVLIHRTRPQYSTDAMRARLQGVTLLSGVVGVDGTLYDIQVLRSLDAAFGLDREAMACVQQWRFRPGMREGKAVAVFVTIEVAFALR